jgi:hypothetical protein
MGATAPIPLLRYVLAELGHQHRKTATVMTFLGAPLVRRAEGALRVASRGRPVKVCKDVNGNHTCDAGTDAAVATCA